MLMDFDEIPTSGWTCFKTLKMQIPQLCFLVFLLFATWVLRLPPFPFFAGLFRGLFLGLAFLGLLAGLGCRLAPIFLTLRSQHVTRNNEMSWYKISPYLSLQMGSNLPLQLIFECHIISLRTLVFERADTRNSVR